MRGVCVCVCAGVCAFVTVLPSDLPWAHSWETLWVLLANGAKGNMWSVRVCIYRTHAWEWNNCVVLPNYLHPYVCVCVSLWEITSGKYGFTQFRYSLHAKRSVHSVCCDIWLRPDLHKHVLVYIETSLMQTRSRVQRRSGSLNERLVWASIQISCPLPARLTRRKLSIFRSVLEAVSSASMQRWQVAFYM